MTFEELRTEVRRRLREAMGTYDLENDAVYFSDVDIDESINEGYEEIADQVEWYETVQTISLLKDRPYYDARTVLRSTFLVLGPAYNNQTSRWMIPNVPRDLDIGDLRWELRVAEPERILVRGLFYFSYWPWKSVATGSIKQYYKALPARLEEDADTPEFHQNFHYGLVEYALFDLFAQDAETELAWSAWKAYEEYEEGLRRYYQNRASVPLMRGAGESQRGY